MASEAFKSLPEHEREEFIASYNNFLEEEMDIALQQAKLHLQQKNISELFIKMYGHLDRDSLLQKDAEWNKTFGFCPLAVLQSL
ncbi:MAG TPA: hypothetical protein VD993_12295 [Chitinophagaceae bacterium]|nr:hypothetical protein [Chitinophagaceae bacterium]